jgi:hypothetical protein
MNYIGARVQKNRQEITRANSDIKFKLDVNLDVLDCRNSLADVPLLLLKPQAPCIKGAGRDHQDQLLRPGGCLP